MILQKIKRVYRGLSETLPRTELSFPEDDMTNDCFLERASLLERKALEILDQELPDVLVDECQDEDLDIVAEFRYASESNDEDITRISKCHVWVYGISKLPSGLFDELDVLYPEFSIEHEIWGTRSVHQKKSLESVNVVQYEILLDANLIRQKRVDFCERTLSHAVKHRSEFECVLGLCVEYDCLDFLKIQDRTFLNFLKSFVDEKKNGFSLFQQEFINTLDLPIADLDKDERLSDSFMKMIIEMAENPATSLDRRLIIPCLWDMEIPCCTKAFDFFNTMFNIYVFDEKDGADFFKEAVGENGERILVPCTITDADCFKMRSSFKDECSKADTLLALCVNITMPRDLQSVLIHRFLDQGKSTVFGGFGDIDEYLFSGSQKFLRKDAGLVWGYNPQCLLFKKGEMRIL